MAQTRVMQTLDIYRQEGKEGVIIENSYGEEESQSYKKGAPLVYHGGEIEILSASGAATTKIIGIAVKDATGTTGAAVPYYEANDYNLFAGSLINSTTATVLAATNIGAKYALIQSTNDWYVDISDTETNIQVEVIGIISDIGDTNPRVIVRFLGGQQSRVLQT